MKERIKDLIQECILEERIKRIIKSQIMETISEKMYEGMGLPSSSIIPLDKFVGGQDTQSIDEIELDAPYSTLPPDELQAYLQKTAAGKKTKMDKFKMPYIHRGNIEIKDENDRTFDLDKLRAAITQRPDSLLKRNAKLSHSGGKATVFFNLGIPALKGLAVNEKNGDFVIVDTCPGAGACKVYCYAKKGGYVQWKASSLSQTKILNFLLNDPNGFVSKLTAELQKEFAKFSKKNVKMVVRWHDAGDFFSDDYKNVAFALARKLPDIDFYAYTKVASIANDPNKPANFKINFSAGATPEQEKQIDFKTTKNSVVVPAPMFTDYVEKATEEIPSKKAGGKTKIETKSVFKSPEALVALKKKLATRYNIPLDSILSYEEMMNTPVGPEKKYNVIVKPGDGDDAANRSDVLGTYLLIH